MAAITNKTKQIKGKVICCKTTPARKGRATEPETPSRHEWATQQRYIGAQTPQKNKLRTSLRPAAVGIQQDRPIHIPTNPLGRFTFETMVNSKLAQRTNKRTKVELNS